VIEGDAQIVGHNWVLAGMLARHAEETGRSDRPDAERRISVVGAKAAAHHETFAYEVRIRLAGVVRLIGGRQQR
jgi:hypothetical protein